MGLVWEGYKQKGDIFRIQVLHKNLTFLLGPEASAVMYDANDKQVSSRELYHFTVKGFYIL